MDLEQIEHQEIIYELGSEFEGVVYELESIGFFGKQNRFYKEFVSGNHMVFSLNEEIMYLRIMSEENYFLVYEGLTSIDSISKLIDLIEANTFIFSVILEMYEANSFINNILLNLIEYEIDTIGFPRIYMKFEEGYCSLYSKLEK